MRSFVMQNAMPFRRLARAAAGAVPVLLSSAVLSVSVAAGTPREAGVWFDETGKGAVKIEPCGGDKLCGRIVWLKDLVNAQGDVLTDKNNPDADQRTRTICGLPVLGQLQAMPEGGYDGGWVYDPKVGKSYSVAIVLTGPDELTVTGYKGVKLLGKSFGWTRAKTELPSCAAAADTTNAVGAKQGGAKPTAATSAAAAKPSDAKKATAGATKPKNGAGGETLPWASKN